MSHRRHSPSSPSASLHADFLNKLGATETVVYIDETFQEPTKLFPDGFYSVCGVVLQGEHVFLMQEDLLAIVGDTYWHSTEALREGREHVFLKVLEHMRAHPTMTVVVTTVDVDDPGESAMEHARREVLTELLTGLSHADDAFRGAIMEQRDSRRKNNADEALVAHLRRSRQIPSETALRITSPQIDRNLWLPDTAAMAYRRTITHPHNETSRWFGDYLQRFSHVTVLPNGPILDPEVLPRWVERMKQIQSNAAAPERHSPGVGATGPLAFLQQKSAEMPLAELIQQQLQRTRHERPKDTETSVAESSDDLRL